MRNLLYSIQKKHIPIFFSGTLLNKNKKLTSEGDLKGDFSNLFFFQPSVTDRSEDVNEHLNNVSI